jgi:hypothetical protein
MRHRVELWRSRLRHPRVLERARPIARGFERSHQPQRDPARSPARRLHAGATSSLLTPVTPPPTGQVSSADA